ncbi:PQQ-dependent sugar dehydrogenase [Opitutus terrae]|uniref:Glucose sorbosone dehydrogenase n=1 Tax=Opitutus terrae (strain DSM 11246 / JCM 15787 / PB90-1) TaxID=452637 RepID=B1ZVK5_OPITP|nr:PQQ-dependent sugar dehydrogenase [Opitutus terrae]ACB74102.1 glucose sorbosone dehydrogenase [Opitutus terrae PB90-1]
MASAADQSPGRDVNQLYAELCSGCHGERMEGGKGGSLIDGHWQHGGDTEALRRSIRDGYAGAGMPSFRAALNDAEISTLVNFIHETATRTVEPEPKQERPLPAGVQHSEEHAFRIEPVASGFDVPWSLTFLPDRRILVTERVGRLRVIEADGQLNPEPVAGLPTNILVRDEAGLMSVVADPDYAHNGWIYLSYSDRGPNDTAMTKIVRGRLRHGRWIDEQEVFAIDPRDYLPSSVLFGGRLAFAGEYLFFSVGERGMEEGTTGQAQDLRTANGKIHRVFHDGRTPPDNPFVGRDGSLGSIWAYGVRNPQGLAINPRDGAVWETEHGPRGGDELNAIRRGANYGWPVITYGMNYDGTPISDKTAAPGMEQPVINWTPSIAVSQLEFYTGDRFPRWKGNLFIGSLAQQKFIRVVVDGDRVVHREEVFRGLGRVRDIKTGPEGNLYLAIELIGKPGRIVRLVPAG